MPASAVLNLTIRRAPDPPARRVDLSGSCASPATATTARARRCRARRPARAGAAAGRSARVLGHRDYVIKVLLHGLSGPIDGKEYNGGAVMVPMGANTDEWIADVANYVRNSFGNARRRSSRRSRSRRSQGARRARRRGRRPSSSRGAGPAGQHGGVEVQRQPQRGERGKASARRRAGTPALPSSRDVVPDRAAADDDGDEVQIDSAMAGGGRGARGNGGLGPPWEHAASAPLWPDPLARAVAWRWRQLSAAGTPAGAAPQGPPQAGGGAGRAAGGGGRGGGISSRRACRLQHQVSTDGTTWAAPIAQGVGQTPTTIIAFKAVPAKFIRITETGAAQNGEWWAIQQVRVYRPGDAR